MTRSARRRLMLLSMLSLRLLAMTVVSADRSPLAAQAPRDHTTGRQAGGQPAWVLITGLVGGVAGFRALEAVLQRDSARVVIIDPYRLSLDSQDVSYAALARRVDRALISLNVYDAHVVGHANGAGVAIRLAALTPTRVASLTFLDAGALRASAGTTLRGSIRFIPLVTRFPGGRAYVRGRFANGVREHAGQHGWLTDSVQRAYVDPMLNDISRVVALAMRLHQTMERDTLEQIIDQLRVPVTVILGGAPHKSGAGPDELDLLRPLGARLAIVRLPGIGHFPHEEAPHVVANLLGTVRRRGAMVARVQP